jgi:hypothetical protein
MIDQRAQHGIVNGSSNRGSCLSWCKSSVGQYRNVFFRRIVNISVEIKASKHIGENGTVDAWIALTSSLHPNVENSQV